MSKKDEQELSRILESLERFAQRREGHVLAVVTYPQTEEEAKGVYVAGDWVRWLIVGDTAITLEMIKGKFHDNLKKLEEKDKAVVREIEMRRRAKK